MAWVRLIGGIGIGGTGVQLGWDSYLKNPANALANANGIGERDTDSRNAIEHTLSSGDVADNIADYTTSDTVGDVAAEIMGNLVEIPSELTPDLTDSDFYERDTFRDQWNNEVGQRMRQWAEDNGYDWDAIKDDLIMNALDPNNDNVIDPNTSKLITNDQDQRIKLDKDPKTEADWT